jgi:hypothetical protein
MTDRDFLTSMGIDPKSAPVPPLSQDDVNKNILDSAYYYCDQWEKELIRNSTLSAEIYELRASAVVSANAFRVLLGACVLFSLAISILVVRR